MFLDTPLEAIRHLKRRQMLSCEASLDTDVSAADVSHRNRNFTIIQRGGPSYFLKQGCGADRAKSVASEARIYEFFGQLAGAAQLRGHLPRCYDFDAGNGVLVLELHPDAQNLWIYHHLHAGYSRTLARALGTSLGLIHRLTAVRTLSPAIRDRLPELGAWVIPLFDRPTPDLLSCASGAAVALVEALARVPLLRERLDALRVEWQASCLIHRDLKWDNCIAYPRRGSRRRTRVSIVDWEFAGVGDPCWDAACLVSDYLHYWIHSLPLEGDEDAEQFLELATRSLYRNRPPIRACIDSYLRSLEVDQAQESERLERTIRYLPAKLVDTAVKLGRGASHPSPTSVGLLQLAANVSEHPDGAGQMLLGL